MVYSSVFFVQKAGENAATHRAEVSPIHSPEVPTYKGRKCHCKKCILDGIIVLLDTMLQWHYQGYRETWTYSILDIATVKVKFTVGACICLVGGSSHITLWHLWTSPSPSPSLPLPPPQPDLYDPNRQFLLLPSLLSFFFLSFYPNLSLSLPPLPLSPSHTSSTRQTRRKRKRSS